MPPASSIFTLSAIGFAFAFVTAVAIEQAFAAELQSPAPAAVGAAWSVSVAVPTVIVDAPLWHNALTMTVIGVVLTLVSLLLAFMVASHLSRAIQRLGIAAVAIASGDVVRMPASNISELRDVSRSIEVTGAVARRNRRADIKSAS